jgi:hypothetical protein
MIRRLPLSPPPVQHETVGSFLGRLADANRLKPHTLPTLLGVRTLPRHADPKDPWPPTAITALATLTGRSLTALAAALPALAPPPPDTIATGRIRPACRSCMSARGITSTVIQHTADHEDVCLRHRRWLNAPEQYLLDHLTDVLAANRRHRSLARRSGPALAAAHQDAQTAVTAWFTTAERPDLHDYWVRRLEALPEDPLGHPGHPSPQRIALAVYPEAVALTADRFASRRNHASPTPP